MENKLEYIKTHLLSNISYIKAELNYLIQYTLQSKTSHSLTLPIPIELLNELVSYSVTDGVVSLEEGDEYLLPRILILFKNGYISIVEKDNVYTFNYHK